MRSHTRVSSRAESATVDNRNVVSSARQWWRDRTGSPSYRSRIEGHAERTNRRLAVAFRIVSILGVLCIAAGGLAAAINLAAPPSVANGAVPISIAREPGLVGATRPLGEAHSAPMLVPSADWLSDGTSQSLDEVLSAQDVAVRDVAPKAPPVVPSAANPSASPSTIAAAASVGTSAGAIRSRSRGTITIVTFGYSFGDAPGGCVRVADVRNIPTNGFSQDETGLMPSIRQQVMATDEAQTWLSIMRNKWMPSLHDGDKVAIGCSRGHHRSVTLGVLFAEDLRAAGYTVNLVHRDIQKTW